MVNCYPLIHETLTICFAIHLFQKNRKQRNRSQTEW